MIEVAETIRERERKREEREREGECTETSAKAKQWDSRGGVVIIIAMCFYVKCVCFYLLN